MFQGDEESDVQQDELDVSVHHDGDDDEFEIAEVLEEVLDFEEGRDDDNDDEIHVREEVIVFDEEGDGSDGENHQRETGLDAAQELTSHLLLGDAAHESVCI